MPYYPFIKNTDGYPVVYAISMQHGCPIDYFLVNGFFGLDITKDFGRTLQLRNFSNLCRETPLVLRFAILSENVKQRFHRVVIASMKLLFLRSFFLVPLSLAELCFFSYFLGVCLVHGRQCFMLRDPHIFCGTFYITKRRRRRHGL